jgi:hypothetical protein
MALTRGCCPAAGPGLCAQVDGDAGRYGGDRPHALGIDTA